MPEYIVCSRELIVAEWRHDARILRSDWFARAEWGIERIRPRLRTRLRAACPEVKVKRYPLLCSPASEIAGVCGSSTERERRLSGGSRPAAGALARGSDSFAVKFWMQDRAPGYRLELERFHGEIVKGPEGILERN